MNGCERLRCASSRQPCPSRATNTPLPNLCEMLRSAMLSPKLLLSPIDFSDSSLSALDVAKDIAKQCGSTILLLHAMPVVPKLTKDLSVLDHGVYELELLEAARLRLGDLAEKVQRCSRQVSVRAVPSALQMMLLWKLRGRLKANKRI
jgi:hypothetical protein